MQEFYSTEKQYVDSLQMLVEVGLHVMYTELLLYPCKLVADPMIGLAGVVGEAGGWLMQKVKSAGRTLVGNDTGWDKQRFFLRNRVRSRSDQSREFFLSSISSFLCLNLIYLPQISIVKCINIYWFQMFLEFRMLRSVPLTYIFKVNICLR